MIAVVFFLLGLSAFPARAVNWQCPCPGMSRDSGMPSSGPPPDCQTVCFGAGGGGAIAPNYYQYQQQQQQQLEIRRQQVLQQQAQQAAAANQQGAAAQQAELGRQQHDIDARAQQIQAQRDAQFLRDRDSVAAGLKGIRDTGLKGGEPETNPVAAKKTKPRSYTKGFMDASGCYSAKAGVACADVEASGQQACLDAYRAGFALGDTQRKQTIQEAYQAGHAARAAGQLEKKAFSDPRAKGSCRHEWIMAFQRGYFEKKPVQP